MNNTFRSLLVALPIALAVIPSVALAHSPSGKYTPAPLGQVVVTNTSGGDVDVALGSEPAQRLGAWQTVTLRAPFGDATLRATYQQLGATRTLQTERLVLTPDHAEYVTLRPETRARVMVTNSTRSTADLYVNGRRYAEMKSGSARVVSLSTGRASLTMVSGGRVVDQTTLDARAFAEHRWTADDPSGDLVVVNPLPIPIELVCSKGLVRTVQAHSQTVYQDLPPGTFRLVARRTTDELIDEATSEIRVGGRSEWRVDAPTTGLVSLDSDHWLAAQVTVDGRGVAGLEPNQATRITLPLGWHRVEARDAQGRVLEDSWIEVEPYETAKVEFGMERPAVAVEIPRHHDDHNHDHAGYVAGASCSLDH